jgi:hypothetical protein
VLAELLSELPELSGTGYDEEDLDALLAELGRSEPGEDDPLPSRLRRKPDRASSTGAIA